ncbi:hypothetical protein CASFOL_027745 [Castilleja foliolosa]|uniref:RING-type E3 ubiquitin transferase n=1 Tax=Castilleja foliolosa TaxID=1961234 RepID=A0ABD3CHG9_9LAMI
MSKISPIILLVIVILAIAFFAVGLIQLLIRCLIKRPSFSLQSNRFPDGSNYSNSFQRQLQHLFRLHDSGLERALIDALPVFYYKDIIGSKEPFDCAVCLCEFSDGDKLKCIPICSHAFHIHCIETWLLSNSTCPLCRSLIGNNSNSTMGSPWLSFGDPMENRSLSGVDESFSQERVFSIRLGKFKNSNEGLEIGDKTRFDQVINSSSSISSIDARRCYSMGVFNYVVDDADLQVSFSGEGGGTKDEARSTIDDRNTELEGKKIINPRSRGDSFSVSKIWLWSKRGKFSSFDANERIGVLPTPDRSDLV